MLFADLTSWQKNAQIQVDNCIILLKQNLNFHGLDSLWGTHIIALDEALSAIKLSWSKIWIGPKGF